ncbi:tripartite tricarboxylate transporter TctB family protein [Natronocella acetinitrilica]|uniref:tripartite tricarboxylate transporter TctB family protein n=1 Tax=Natronocella acetinitrilica TaxID=414046 RepID=UPI00344F4945
MPGQQPGKPGRRGPGNRLRPVSSAAHSATLRAVRRHQRLTAQVRLNNEEAHHGQGPRLCDCRPLVHQRDALGNNERSRANKLATLRLQLFPRIVLVILGVLSLALLVRSFVVRLPVATPTDEPGLDAAAFWQRYRRTFFLFAGFGLYAWLLPRLGFIIASLLFVGSMQALLLGRVRPRQALMIGLLTVG